jgi:hypothetical protein
MGCDADLSRRRFRHATSVRIFLEQLTLRLQPIIHIVPMSAAALDVDLVRA